MAPIPDVTDDLLRLADGDRSAFEPVYAVAWPRVRALARRMTGGSELADDIAQQALLKVFERASDFDATQGRALPWILGIAAWEVRTLRRRHARSREEPLTGEWAHSAPGPDDQLDHARLVQAVQDALGELSPADVHTLLAAAGLRDRPPVSGGTFRKRLQRARTRLRAAWKGSHG